VDDVRQLSGFLGRRGLAVAALAVAGGALAAGGAAQTTSKPYTAAITPSSVPSGTAQQLELRITNASATGTPTNQPLGSANLTIPSGWAVSAASAAIFSSTGAPVAKTWTATVNTGTRTVELRAASSGDRLDGGQQVRATLTASAPSVCAPTSYAWPIVVKQSNRFLGTGNDFYLDGPVPSVQTTAAVGPLQSFSVAAVSSPQVAGTSFGVSVTARDACGNVKTNYAGGAGLSSNLGPAPDGTSPIVPATLSWSSGVGTATLTAFNAETGRTVTVADGAVSAASNTFTVLPGPLDRFALASVASPQTAGTAFSVGATAYDAWDNVKTNYGGGASLSATFGEAPDGTDPIVPSALSWSSGIGSATTTAFKAETGQTVTVSDGSVSATSNAFTVQPGPLDRFALDPVASQQTAGTAFAVGATAYDAWDNVKTNYAGTGTLGGSLAPSVRGCGVGGASACQPSYSLTWSGDGTATGSATPYAAASGQTVSVSDGSVSASSNGFTVEPDAVADLAFVQQPTDTLFNASITPAPTVLATDRYGNVATNASGNVSVAIGANPGGGTLSGTTSQPLSAGVGTFAGLSIDKAGLGYTLAASFPGASGATSAPFDVVTAKCVDDTVNCSATTDPNGNGTSAQQNTVGSVEVIDTGATGDGQGSIFLGLEPTAVCTIPGGQQIGVAVVFVPTGFPGAYAQLRVEYDKTTAPGTGVANFTFCIDKEETAGVDYTIVPDCPKKNLNTYVDRNGPCILKRNRTNAGDLEVFFYLKATDPKVGGIFGP
jgi:hypothetical protein